LLEELEMKHYIVNHQAEPDELELLFGPLDGTEEFVTTDTDDLAAMACDAGIYTSRAAARLSGLAGPCPMGVWTFGTSLTRFVAWNPHSPTRKVTVSPQHEQPNIWLGF